MFETGVKRAVTAAAVTSFTAFSAVLPVTTASPAHRPSSHEVQAIFAPGVVREGERFVTLAIWNRTDEPTCAPLTVTINRIHPASIQSVRPPDGWTSTLGNEARVVSPVGLDLDQSGVIRMWVDAQSVLPWRSTVYEADVYCGTRRIASDRLDVAW